MQLITYLVQQYPSLLRMLGQTLQLVVVSLAISIAIAIPLGLLLLRVKWLEVAVMSLLGMIFAIPSLTLFSLLVPLVGLGKPPAIIALVAYAQLLLVRNILAGFHGISPAIVEAGRGMGLSPTQLLVKVQLPLAMPVLLAGLRIAVISTIGISTIAALVNAGGIGQVLFEGLRMSYWPKIVWGTIISAGLALGANALLLRAEKRSLRVARGERTPKDKAVG